jgi:vancomycin resistance protein YoaR
MKSSAIKKAALGGAILVALVLALLLAFRIAYWNRILPGVKIGSLYLGGLTKSEAKALIDQQVEAAKRQTIAIQAGTQTVDANTSDLVSSYDTDSAAEYAYSIGRSGLPWHQLREQAVSLVGWHGSIHVPVALQPDAAAELASKLANSANTPVQNAQFDSSAGFAIKAGQPGDRVQPAMLYSELKSQIGSFGTPRLTTPTYQIAPPLTVDTLALHKDFIKKVAANPINLTADGKNWQVTSDQLLGWLVIDTNIKPLAKTALTGYYSLPPQINGPQFNEHAIREYIQNLAGSIDQEPVDAQLSWNGSSVVVTKASANGRKLDTTTSANQLIAALNTGNNQSIPLVVAIQKPEVREDNLAQLGIKELVSEGISYFPHSSAARMQNVRVGASKFQNVLVKPNSVFSFDDIMGYVGAETGYAPSKVILGDHQEFQYGGGMCQVSSTAFRAALNGGYPILQRTNHAFAVDYYTQPYGVPGVDATVYAPEVDMKFRNDTPHYILIQTTMVGTTLKFDFYSTKTKSGVVRGPYFISGSLDPNIPSQTVFYRDVVVNGQVAKTDTFNTYYKSALDFPNE